MNLVGQIADEIAPYVGMSYPNDEKRLFDLLSLVQDQIWMSGKFYNSTKYFYTPVRDNNHIITPHGYNVLLGCNIDFKPVSINGVASIFHKNGPLEAPLKDTGFSRSVYHLGDSPVMIQPNDEWCSPCSSSSPREYYVAVCGGGCDTGKETLVSALGCNKKPIYTYRKEETESEPIVCEDRDLQETEIRYSEGVVYPILGQKVYHENILVSEIYNIIKDPTTAPVEYYLVDKDTRVGVLTARLEPYETNAIYKRYQVSQSCVKAKCILGLYKKSKPVKIVDPSQIFISGNMQAIMSIAQGIDHKYSKGDIEKGMAYIRDGINLLNLEVREERPNKNSKLQVESIRDFSEIKPFR